MKKVLFISSENPEDQDLGDRKYTFGIIQSIKLTNSYLLHFVCFESRKYHSNSNSSRLNMFVDKITYIPYTRRNKLEMVLSRYPAMIANRVRKNMINKIDEILQREQYDAIIINHVKMAYLIEIVRKYPGVKIHVSHNVESQVAYTLYRDISNLFSKLFYFLDYLKTLYWEKKFLSKYDIITAICDYDKRESEKLFPHLRIVTLRPFVEICDSTNSCIASNKIIICGSFTWVAKKINIYNLLKSSNFHKLYDADIQLIIVGRMETKDVETINKIRGVTATGAVASVDPYYMDADMALVPELTGGGFKLKIAEAVQKQIPIVALRGSITDDIIKSGIHYVEANNYEDMIEKAILLHSDTKMKSNLVKNATNLFNVNYSIEKASEVILSIL